MEYNYKITPHCPDAPKNESGLIEMIEMVKSVCQKMG